MVKVVGAGGQQGQLWWWDPLGVAGGQLSGGPALVEQLVVRRAGEGQCVDVDQTAPGPVLDVVNLAQMAGCRAARRGAAAVLGMMCRWCASEMAIGVAVPSVIGPVITGYGPLTYCDKHNALAARLPALQLISAVWSGAAPRMWGGRFGMPQLFM